MLHDFCYSHGLSACQNILYWYSCENIKFCAVSGFLVIVSGTMVEQNCCSITYFLTFANLHQEILGECSVFELSVIWARRREMPIHVYRLMNDICPDSNDFSFRFTMKTYLFLYYAVLLCIRSNLSICDTMLDWHYPNQKKLSSPISQLK